MSSSRKDSPRGRSRGRRRKAPDDLDLGTDKLYFKIGEVAEIVGVEAYVLRYWESEFATLKPQKSRSRQRVYRRKDVETLLKIKHLLYDRKFTIAGARQELERGGKANVDPAPANTNYRAQQSLGPIREQLEQLKALLREDDATTLAAADPAEYVRRLGGGESLVKGLSDEGSLLARPERDFQ